MRRFLTILFATALVFAACGGDSGPDPAEDPKGALRAALEAIGDYEGITAEFTVDTDVASMVAVSEGDLTEDEAQTILDSSLSFTAKEGETPEDSQAEIVADIGGDLVEMRVVDNVIYARADVEELVERFGGNPQDIEAGLADAPPQFGFLDEAVNGEWIGLEGAEQLAQQFGAAQPSEEEAAQLQEEIANKLSEAIDENSTVESVGSDDVGEHLEVKLAVRPLAEAFIEIARSAPGGEAIPAEAFDLSDVPDEDLPVDVWIADGRVSQIELDIVKAAEAFGEADDTPEGVERFALRLTLEEFTGDVEAPDAVETVNIGELMQMFMGGFGAGSGSMEGSGEAPDLSDLCAQLEGQPEEVVSQFAEECPELQQ